MTAQLLAVLKFRGIFLQMNAKPVCSAPISCDGRRLHDSHSARNSRSYSLARSHPTSIKSTTLGSPAAQFIRKAESKLVMFLSVLLYGKSCDSWTRRFQSRPWNLRCSFGQGDEEVGSLRDLLTRLSPSMSKLDVKLYYHPFLRETLLISSSVFGLNGPRSRTDFRTVCTILRLIHRHTDLTKSDTISRFTSILQLYDIDEDECLTLYELYYAFFASISLSIRLSDRAKSPLEISTFAENIARQATKAVAECVYPNFNEMLIFENNHISCIVRFDEISQVLSRKPYLVSFLFNPASLDCSLFIPQSYRSGPETVLYSVLSKVNQREIYSTCTARYHALNQYIQQSRDMPPMTARLESIKRGLLSVKVILDPGREWAAKSEAEILPDPEWNGFVYFLGCAIPDLSSRITYTEIPDNAYHVSTRLTEYMSIAGIYKLQEMGERPGIQQEGEVDIACALQVHANIALFPDLHEPFTFNIPDRHVPHEILSVSKCNISPLKAPKLDSSPSEKNVRRASETRPSVTDSSDYCPVCDTRHK